MEHAYTHTYLRLHASQGCHNLFRKTARLLSRPDDNNQAHMKLGETRLRPPLDGEHSSFPGEPPSPMELEAGGVEFPSFFSSCSPRSFITGFVGTLGLGSALLVLPD